MIKKFKLLSKTGQLIKIIEIDTDIFNTDYILVEYDMDEDKVKEILKNV